MHAQAMTAAPEPLARATPGYSGADVDDAPADIEHLFEEHHDRMFRAAYRVTGNADDAEDVLQTVFLRLLRRAEPPDLRPSPGSYLYRAAVNAALDVVRGRGSSPTVALDEGAAEPPGPEAQQPDRQTLGRELRDHLRRAVAKLQPRHAEMFVLHHFEGRPLAEIADLLGTSKGVVAVTLFRSRSRLKKELASFAGESR